MGRDGWHAPRGVDTHHPNRGHRPMARVLPGPSFAARLVLILVSAALASLPAASAPAPGNAPRPLPHHPGNRVRTEARIQVPTNAPSTDGWVVLRHQSGSAARSVVAFRVRALPDPALMSP
jgi:hypothetical protein